MVRLRMKYVIVIAVLLFAALSLVRGCRLARKKAKDLPGEAADMVISVYDHREKQVKEMPLETYLVGVVAAEMPISFHPEALKAQSVAARTYTLRKLTHGGCRAHDANICTDSGCCQAFLSDARMAGRWGGDLDANRAIASEAVQLTSGEVITYDGELIEALYHSSSGGQTEASEDAFTSAEPYLVSVMSTNESGVSQIKSAVSYTAAQFIKRVAESYPKANLSADTLPDGIEILKASKSGRVLELRLGNTVVTGRQARSLFGLKSTLFTVEATKKGVTFSVSGSGHGVGMSQTGANGMALGGCDYRAILRYYYRGVEITQYDGAVP